MLEEVSQPIEVDSCQLKKILEWELSLDNRDLRSHAWYHGAISRIRAEEIVGQQDGDFLVRDCTSQPGDYVLSCRSKGQNLHFVISKIVLQADTVYETIQYRFEEDGFDTVPDLITYYVGSGKPITSTSGARIQNPRNRLNPLSFYTNQFELRLQQNAFQFICNPHRSPVRSRNHQSRMQGKKQRSFSLLPTNLTQTSNGDVGSPIIEQVDGFCSFSNSLPRRNFSSKMIPVASHTTMPRNLKLQRASDSIMPGFTNGKHEPVADIEPPPKPSRLVKTMSMQEDLGKNNNNFYLISGSDSGNGSGDSVHSYSNGGESDCSIPVSTIQRSGVVIKNPKYYCMSSTNSTATSKAYTHDPVINLSTLSVSNENTAFELVSAFHLESFHTLLLPTSENKPLDTTALQGIHMLLLDSGSRILANHLTRVDLELTIRQLNKIEDCMCQSGIELCILPHGHQHRQDLIERTMCIQLLVAVTILTCGTESERAELLNKWIEMAIDIKTALGNLFGFNSIMLGLCTPQVQRLNETWHILRQKYTDSAFNFEAKLKPTLKSMNESTNPLAPNTTIPHLLPILLLYERSFDHLSENPPSDKIASLISNISQWECASADHGLSTLFAHLNSTRQFHKSLPTFRRNAEIVLTDSKIDDLLIDMFRTEFHLKFLWGSRGATAPFHERYSKFEQVLDVMSQKCEIADMTNGADNEVQVT